MNKIIGAVIIIAGVYLVVTGDEYDETDKIRDVMNSEAANKEDDCR